MIESFHNKLVLNPYQKRESVLREGCLQKTKNYSRGIAQRGFMGKIVPKNKYGSFQIKICMYIVQSLTIAIVFELIYYTNGHPRA